MFTFLVRPVQSAAFRALMVCGAGALFGNMHSALAQTRVDIELVLAVDTSSSMDYSEQILQRDGYVAAFRSPEVLRVILSGYHKKIAVTYLEWGGASRQKIVIPWTLIDSPQSAHDFADRLAKPTPVSSDRTSISNALLTARDLLLTNRFEGTRMVVDVSGDGPNNDGPYVNIARDHLLKDGIIINGLPILAKPTYLGFGIDRLDIYYQECVIGGESSFMIPVYDWSEFPKAIRKKIVLELSNNRPSVRPENPPLINVAFKDGRALSAVPANAQTKAPYNCQTGEETWKKFHLDWKYYHMPPPD